MSVCLSPTLTVSVAVVGSDEEIGVDHLVKESFDEILARTQLQQGNRESDGTKATAPLVRTYAWKMGEGADE